MASTRLRKTFRYPTDGDNEDSPTALDEEEQEKLISSLQSLNQKSNDQYKRLFLALPILSTIPYISILFTSSTGKLLALLSITSLISTSYLLHALPADKTGLDFVDERGNAGGRKTKRGGLSSYDARGPVLRYLPLLNVCLAGVVMVLGMMVGAKSADPEHAQMLNYLPLAIYLFILLVKSVMGSVDVEELAELKYDYKGA